MQETTIKDPKTSQDATARLELARAAWLKILEAARRLRPIVDSLSGEPPNLKGFRGVAGAALDSRGLLDDFYRGVSEKGWGVTLGALPAVDENLIDAMGDLLSIASLAAVALNDPEPFSLREGGRLDHWEIFNQIDRLVWSLEERVGRDWAEPDPSIPQQWAAVTRYSARSPRGATDLPDPVILDDTDDFTVTLWQTDRGATLLRLRVPDGEWDFPPTAPMFDGASTGAAARLVFAAVTNNPRSDVELAAARSFLRQWPDGPQLPEELNARVNRALIRDGFYQGPPEGGHHG